MIKLNKYFYLLCLICTLNIISSSNIKLELYPKNNTQYIKATDLARAYNANTIFYPEKDKLELKSANFKITLSPFSSFIKIDDEIFHLHSKVLYQDKEFYIPFHSFSNITNNTKLPNIYINKKNNLVELNSPTFNITDFSVQKKINGAIISISTTKPFIDKSISASISRGGWLNITIPNGFLDSLKLSKAVLKSPVVRYKSYQSNESCQLSFMIKNKVDDIEINATGETISIILRMATNSNANKIKKMREKWFIDTIVIDAGHGGKDPGAVGKRGLQEKTITLDVAKKLKKLIEKNINTKVIMTRNEDSFIPLWKRTKIANDTEGKLLISIHANSAPKSPRARGFETYLLRLGKIDDAIEVVRRENDVIKMEEKEHKYHDFSIENSILSKNLQNKYMKESEFFAAEIQRQIDKISTAPNRGVKQAGFHVLVGADMPNVLIELGFLSNRNEEKMLGKSSYRQKLANAIFNAIVVFKDKYESSLIE